MKEKVLKLIIKEELGNKISMIINIYLEKNKKKIYDKKIKGDDTREELSLSDGVDL